MDLTSLGTFPSLPDFYFLVFIPFSTSHVIKNSSQSLENVTKKRGTGFIAQCSLRLGRKQPQPSLLKTTEKRVGDDGLFKIHWTRRNEKKHLKRRKRKSQRKGCKGVWTNISAVLNKRFRCNADSYINLQSGNARKEKKRKWGTCLDFISEKGGGGNGDRILKRESEGCWD